MHVIKGIFRRLGVDIRKYNRASLRTKVITLHPGMPSSGTALLAYMLKPFLLEGTENVPCTHTNLIESLLIADVLLKLGYEVDVIDFENNTFEPKKPYDILISSRKHFQRYSELVGSECLKIAHLDVSHWLYNNTAALKRCYEVHKKKGVALGSYRPIEENYSIECADYAIMIGNETSMKTYAYSGKPIEAVPVPVFADYPEPRKDYDAVRKKFLWFGSWGFIQKGLDLVLEAFSEMPEYRLKVCGPIDREPRFKRAYHRELYELKNIETIGWVDVTSERFLNLINDTIGLIYPSCAEGQSGAVITCMHAGIIPIASRQSGVDLRPEYGRYLEEISVEEIKVAVRTLSAMPTDELRQMSRNAWLYTREHHTKERYSRRFENVMETILARTRVTRDAGAGAREKLGQVFDGKPTDALPETEAGA